MGFFCIDVSCDCGLVMEVLGGFVWFLCQVVIVGVGIIQNMNFGRQKFNSDGQFCASTHRHTDTQTHTHS